MQADDLPPEEQRLACLRILYPRWQELPSLAEAFTEAMRFINLGRDVDTDLPAAATLADWGEDVQLIAPAVDEVLGYSCRQCAYLHWWDFLGAYMNIDPEGLQKILGTYAFANRLPREQEIVGTLTYKPKILERKSILQRIAEKIRAFIDTFIEGMGGV